MASTTHSIRQQNKQLVLKTLFQNGALFASDLVKKTGISMVTTNSLLKELLAEEEITKVRWSKRARAACRDLSAQPRPRPFSFA